MLDLIPKMVVVRTSMAEMPCCLASAIADQFDESGDHVILRDAVTIDGNMTTIVPAAICFEFDQDMMDAINALVNDAAALTEQAEDKLVGAKMLAELGLEQAAFEIDADGVGMRDLDLDDAA